MELDKFEFFKWKAISGLMSAKTAPALAEAIKIQTGLVLEYPNKFPTAVELLTRQYLFLFQDDFIWTASSLAWENPSKSPLHIGASAWKLNAVDPKTFTEKTGIYLFKQDGSLEAICQVSTFNI
jgi:hypothetical protein